MIVVALFVLARRVLVGVALGAVVATILSFTNLGTGRSWVECLGLALVAVGCIALMMAFAGHSPGMRLGTQDARFAGLYPQLARRLGDSYSGTRVSDSVVFAAAGVVLVVVGLALV